MENTKTIMNDEVMEQTMETATGTIGKKIAKIGLAVLAVSTVCILTKKVRNKIKSNRAKKAQEGKDLIDTTGVVVDEDFQD